MKILFFQWNSFLNKGIERALHKLNIEYDTLFYQLQDWENDETFSQLLEEKLRKKNYALVFSVNFIPLISECCELYGLPYVAWVYDSPIHIRDQRALRNKNTHVYFFDRGQVEEYRKQRIPVEYMPLAVDELDFINTVNGIEKGTYKTDISFVGQLYKTELAYFATPLDEYQKGYLEGIINAQSKVSGGYFLSEVITDTLLESLNQKYHRISNGTFQMGKRELEYMLACEITSRERYMILQLLSNHFQVDFYSDEPDERLKNVRFRGYADYYTLMPQVFSESSVNLNISLKTIRTGIPLRVLDIMGCGGFVISNFQEELGEYFRIGEECEIYENIEDLFCKTKFYLRNEDLRKQIAYKGKERVKRDFSFEERLQKMLKPYI